MCLEFLSGFFDNGLMRLGGNFCFRNGSCDEVEFFGGQIFCYHFKFMQLTKSLGPFFFKLKSGQFIINAIENALIWAMGRSLFLLKEILTGTENE